MKNTREKYTARRNTNGPALTHLLFLSLLLLLVTATTNAAEPALHDIGPYKIRATINPETVKVGRNAVSLWITDQSGEAVRGATLKVVAIMPSMGAMPAMYAPAEMTETEPGRYEGDFEPSMGGEWPLTIEIEGSAGTGKITYDLATGRKGIRCSVCPKPSATRASAQDPAGFNNVGAYQIRTVVDPEVPKVGRNKVSVWLKDSTDAPVNGATLKVVAVMPSMGAMPAMYAPAEMTETEPGRYEGEFEPAMAGEWPLTIEIQGDAGTAKITYELATGRKGLRCSICNQQSDMRGTIHVDPARRQLIGITTGLAQLKTLRVTTRAAGRITYDETRLHDITLKFNGWIGELTANAIGKAVKKGQPMFTVYSPDLLAAQEEYLQTRKRIKARGGKGGHLLRAATRRLRLWDLSKQQISALAKRGKALEYIPILAKVDGVIIDKQIVAGSAFVTGQRLLRIADLSQVWVEAQVYDYELPLISTGMDAIVVLPELQDREFKAKVDFILPFMQGDTRTATIRVVLDNTDGFLLPNMYAHIHLQADLGKRLLVPESAVLYAGQSRIVFVDLGDGRLSPRKIKTGQRSRDWIEVLQGLNAGEQVITSGNFLIAAESKLKSGIEQW